MDILFLVPFALILVIALVVGLAFVERFARKRATGTYRVVKPLSEPEQTLYWRLKEAMPECVVLGQVSFSRFLRPDGPASARRSLFLGISQKTVDFLVCLPDFTVVAAVEVDDSSHSKPKDARRDALLTSAGVPVVRLRVEQLPSVGELRAFFTR